MTTLLRRLTTRRAVQAEFCHRAPRSATAAAALEQARTQATAHRFGQR